MDELTVFYDETCELCRRCRDWLLAQPTYVPLSFVPLQSPLLEERFPEVAAHEPSKEILVAGSNGTLYRGGSAWIMCLWATRTYRAWSLRLAEPALFPLVRKFCSLVSSNRLWISSLLPIHGRELAATIEACHDAECVDDTCPR
jgi:predicted DCC family thiol-disulfide oxidoreductase YuxK